MLITETQFKKLNSQFLFQDIIANDAGKVFEIGQLQYEEYVRSTFIIGSADIIKNFYNQQLFKVAKRC